MFFGSDIVELFTRIDSGQSPSMSSSQLSSSSVPLAAASPAKDWKTILSH